MDGLDMSARNRTTGSYKVTGLGINSAISEWCLGFAKENGCLQIIPGSHHAGRIDHVLTGDQAGADIDHQYPEAGRRTALHLAVISGNMSVVQWLTLLGADLNREVQDRLGSALVGE